MSIETKLKQVSDQEKIEASKKAILHVLKRIRDNDEVAYLLGFKSESFDLLTEAYAKLTDEPDQEKVQEAFSR
jgi:hypothetical protein